MHHETWFSQKNIFVSINSRNAKTRLIKVNGTLSSTIKRNRLNDPKNITNACFFVISMYIKFESIQKGKPTHMNAKWLILKTSHDLSFTVFVKGKKIAIAQNKSIQMMNSYVIWWRSAWLFFLKSFILKRGNSIYYLIAKSKKQITFADQGEGVTVPLHS